MTDHYPGEITNSSDMLIRHFFVSQGGTAVVDLASSIRNNEYR